jgi:hypothetical protein
MPHLQVFAVRNIFNPEFPLNVLFEWLPSCFIFRRFWIQIPAQSLTAVMDVSVVFPDFLLENARIVSQMKSKLLSFTSSQFIIH